MRASVLIFQAASLAKHQCACAREEAPPVPDHRQSSDENLFSHKAFARFDA
jgi:hypothetical protein